MTDPPRAPQAATPSTPDELLVTVELLRRAKQGDTRALEVLTGRYLPRLQRWASGRLPAFARSLTDTNDVVQETLLKAIAGLDGIEVRGPGGFQAYLRAAVLNRIQDQIRWARRRMGSEAISEQFADSAPSPLEHAIGAEMLERYEQALARLSDEEREVLHLRVELDFDYDTIAAMSGRPSRDAARMAVQRALRRLAEEMGHGR